MFFSKKITIPFFALFILFSCGETKTAEAEAPKAETPAPKVEKGHDAATFPSGTFKDPRDNREYKTVTIVNREWFAENLQFPTKYSYCYDDHPSNCRTHGRLYEWYDGTTACPKGWRMPDNKDWGVLNKRFVRNASVMYKALKMNGEAGFNASLNGWRMPDGTFSGMDKKAGFWSQKEISENTGRYYILNPEDKKFYKSNAPKQTALACRCVRTVKK